MSAGEDQSLAAFWQACPDADREERKWLEGSRVTLEDLERGSERIQRCTSADWWRSASQSSGFRQQDRQSGGASPAQVPAAQRTARRAKPADPAESGRPKPLFIPFGKHRGKLAIEVREEDPGYWNWMLRDVAGWAAKVAAAGLLDDEDDAA